MTISATENAFLALAAALDASAILPEVRRDPLFDDIFERLEVGSGIGRVLALRAGDSIDTQRTLGDPDSERFDLVRNAELEFYVSGPEGDALHAAFDEGILAIFAAIEADKTLCGAVDAAEIVEQPDLGTEEAGALAVLTAVIRVQLTFVSPRAY